MKKYFALLLAAVMCLSLVACGGETPNTNDNNGTEQSEQLGGESTEQTIEITLDNWQEYLEINQYFSVWYFPNAFDEVEGEPTLTFYVILETKEEYSNYMVDWYSDDGIAVEYDMDYCPKDIIYNLEDFSFELIDCVSHPEATVDESEFPRGWTGKIPGTATINRDKIVDGKVEKNSIQYATNFGEQGLPLNYHGTEIEQNEDGTGYIAKCPTNIQITRIQGTLEYND